MNFYAYIYIYYNIRYKSTFLNKGFILIIKISTLASYGLI